MNNKLGAAIVALVVAGCGGGDEPKRSASEPKPDAAGTEQDAASKRSEAESETARFIEKADEICASFNDRWVGVPEASAEYYRNWRQTNADLAALDPPARISNGWNRFLTALEQQLRFTEEERGLDLKQAYERKEKVAQKLGMTDCSSR